MNQYVVHLKLVKYCKSTIPQLKKKTSLYIAVISLLPWHPSWETTNLLSATVDLTTLDKSEGINGILWCMAFCVWFLSFGLMFRVSHIAAFYSQVIFHCIGITFCLFIHQLMGIPLNFSKEVSVLFF